MLVDAKVVYEKSHDSFGVVGLGYWFVFGSPFLAVHTRVYFMVVKV